MSIGSVVLALIAAFVVSIVLAALGLSLTGFEWILIFAGLTAAAMGVLFWRRRRRSRNADS